ncbi:phage tail tape measure protein [Verrucosispora sp. TAA-831]|uniref:phage tail tape measure protein n=1 Tax=Verrucosispora sp. TAA-831 TaxID=3422227 RepID=UPI003D6E4981
MATIANLLIKMGVDVRGVKDADKAAPVAERAGQKTGRSFAEGFRKTARMVGRIAGTAALAGGVAAGGMLAQGLDQALQKSKVDALLATQIASTPEAAAKAGQIAGDLYKKGFGESAAGVADAVKSVLQNGVIDPEAATADIEKVAARAISVGQVMGEEYDRVGASVSTMLKSGIAKNAEDAFDVLVRGTQLGVNKGQDLLDTFTEYSGHFKAIGLDAATSLGLMNQAISKGGYNADKAADALKEFSIRSVDGSKAARDSFKALGFDADKMQRIFAKGGPKAAEAFGQVITKLKETEGQANHAEIAFGLLGTQSEDLKGALLAMDPKTAAAGLGELEGAAGKAGDTLQGSTAAKVEAFKRRVEGAFMQLAEAALPHLDALMDKLEGVNWDQLGGQAATALQQIGPLLKQLQTDAGPGLADSLKVGAEVMAFAADNVDLLAKALPYLAAGFVLVKTAQLAANAASALSPVLTLASAMANRRLAASNAQLAAAMTASTAAMRAQAVGQAASTAATTAGDAAQKRSLISATASRVAMIATAVATKVWAAAQWLLNAAMSANPLGLIIIAIIALVAAIVILWKKNEGFRNLVLAVWAAIKTGIGAAVNWLKTAVPAAWAFIVNAVKAYLQMVRTVVSTVWGWITAYIRTVVNLWRAVISAAWSLIVSVVTGAINRVRAIIAGIGVIAGVIRGAFDRARAGAVNRLTALMTFVRSIPGKITSALSSLKSKMLTIGQNIVAGLRDGISGAWHMVTSKVKELTNLIPAKIREYLGIASPSKVTTRLGRFIAEGLVKGLTGSAKAIKAAAARVSRLIAEEFTGSKRRKLQARVAADTKRLLDLSGRLTKVTEKRAAAEKKLNDLLAARTKLASDTADKVRDSFSLVQDEGPATIGSMISRLTESVTAAKAFAQNMKTLAKRGLAGDLLQQLAEAGPVAGAATAAALAGATDAELAQLNQLAKELDKTATATGNTVADALYSAGIKAAKGLVAGLKAQEKAIEAQMLRIAKGMAKAIKKALKIKSPSRVMRDLMGWVGRGAALGLDDGRRKVEHAAGRLAAAAMPAPGGWSIAGGSDDRPGWRPGWRPPPPPTPATTGGGGDTHYHFAGAAPTEQQIAAIEARRARKARAGRKR